MAASFQVSPPTTALPVRSNRTLSVVALGCIFLAPTTSHAQEDCASTMAALQSRAGQLSGFVDREYRQGIPQRCAGHLPCMNENLARLSAFYREQMGRIEWEHQQAAPRCAAAAQQAEQAEQTSASSPADGTAHGRDRKPPHPDREGFRPHEFEQVPHQSFHSIPRYLPTYLTRPAPLSQPQIPRKGGSPHSGHR
jgi:hypothetical protein